MSEETETKIVIVHKGDAASVGVQRTDCDPILFTFRGDLLSALRGISGFLDEAGRKWQANPRNPKAELPAPPPQAVTTAPKAPGSQSKPNKQQEAMF
jgi:hypothetical protein